MLELSIRDVDMVMISTLIHTQQQLSESENLELLNFVNSYLESPESYEVL